MDIISQISPVSGWQVFGSGEPVLNHLFNVWITIMGCTVFLCFVIGEWTRNYSQTDKVWSIMPGVYSLVTLQAFPSSPRIILMTLLVMIWGIRLSYNFYRKGGYNLLPWKGEEDYRWAVLRRHPKLQKGIRFTLFNLFFISFYQQALILLFSTPLLLAAGNADTPLSLTDHLAAFFMLLFILLESIADNQLHDFHARKQGKVIREDKYNVSLEKGFLTEGLWSYVRHPNFISEQAIWVSFYFFGVAACGQFMNWTLSGPILLILLFMGSSAFTERISMDKYPDYKNYMQDVPKFIPALFKQRKEEERTHSKT